VTAPVVVLGWGNPSRGDDALGPLLCDRLAEWLPERSDGGSVAVFQDFQLQIEHALDLVDRDLVLFIDAALDVLPPYALTRIAPRQDASHSTHALSPQAVLAVFEQVQGRVPPPAWLLRVRGESFDLGEPLSENANAASKAAWQVLQELLNDASEAAWDRLVTPGR
jgi:hydrogenase maturation protease